MHFCKQPIDPLEKLLRRQRPMIDSDFDVGVNLRSAALKRGFESTS